MLFTHILYSKSSLKLINGCCFLLKPGVPVDPKAGVALRSQEKCRHCAVCDVLHKASAVSHALAEDGSARTDCGHGSLCLHIRRQVCPIRHTMLYCCWVTVKFAIKKRGWSCQKRKKQLSRFVYFKC